MKTPLHTIISDLRRLPLDAQIDKLVAAVAAEKPHSVRRTELLSLLQEKRKAELKRNNRKNKSRAA
jgi:hypothetical protein